MGDRISLRDPLGSPSESVRLDDDFPIRPEGLLRNSLSQATNLGAVGSQWGIGALGSVGGFLVTSLMRTAGVASSGLLVASRIFGDECLSSSLTCNNRQESGGWRRRFGYEMTEGVVAQVGMFFAARFLPVKGFIGQGALIGVISIFSTEAVRLFGSESETVPLTLSGILARAVDINLLLLRGKILRPVSLDRPMDRLAERLFSEKRAPHKTVRRSPLWRGPGRWSHPSRFSPCSRKVPPSRRAQRGGFEIGAVYAFAGGSVHSARDHHDRFPDSLLCSSERLGAQERIDIVRQTQPLVKRTAYSYARRVPSSISLDDLISAGNLGLVDALNRYDPRQGVNFEQFARQQIKGAMIDYMRGLDPVAKDRRGNLNKSSKKEEAFRQRLGREPQPEELAGELGISLEELELLRQDRSVGVVLMDDVGSDGFLRERFADLRISPSDEQVHSAQIGGALATAIASLKPRQRLVIQLSLAGSRLREIGQTLNVTEARACQIYAEAVRDLRESFVQQGYDPSDFDISDRTRFVDALREKEKT